MNRQYLIVTLCVFLIMDINREVNGSRLKQCNCHICLGAFVNTKTFYKHSRNTAVTQAPVPKSFYDENQYLRPNLSKPLYEGAPVTLIEAVFEHFYVFATNNGMSKSAMSDSLQTEKSHLPEPNILPASFREAKQLIKPLLMPVQKYDVCINDCIIFRNCDKGDFSTLESCNVCNEPRKIRNVSQKVFHYMAIGPRLVRWFGTSNLCKILYAGQCSTNGKLKDFTDGNIFQSWYKDGGVFDKTEEQNTVPLALFTDGVNPNRNMNVQKSMWPLLLTWINLPMQIRHLLGPMLLVGIIPSGKKGCEPKTLEPFIELLVDEILRLSEYPVYNNYLKAPVQIKVALLQFLCDIPAYSKLLHLTGHSGLRSCSYCKETGVYDKILSKTIHTSNRCFLEENNPLRFSARFSKGSIERGSAPAKFAVEEERVLRELYDNKPNKTQKNIQSKNSGLKGNYALTKLPYHNRLQQMQPDGMHTIADFVSHVMDLLIGKSDSKNVRLCEKENHRFPETWPVEDEQLSSTSKPGKAKLLPPAPWRLRPESIREADRRAMLIQYPVGTDITPGPHFSKPWTLRTMASKLKFVQTGAFQWCIKDLLPKRQESTLFKVFSVITRMTCEELDPRYIPDLQRDTHVALSLLERDFPLTLQNLVTHLLHHIADGLFDNGPLYGRWLFPYERANGWMTRQGLKKGSEEATIMETYVIYDWCMYMLLSQKLSPRVADGSAADHASAYVKNLLEDKQEERVRVLGKTEALEISSEISTSMKNCLQSADTSDINIHPTCLKANSLDFKKTHSRFTRYCGTDSASVNKNSTYCSFILNGSICYGQISYFLMNKVNGADFYWAVVSTFSETTSENGMLKAVKFRTEEKIVQLIDLSFPLVTCDFEDYVVIINP